MTAPPSVSQPKKGRKKWIIIAVAIVAVALVATYLVIEYLPMSPPAAPASPNVIIWSGIGCSGTQNCGFVPTVRNVTVGTMITWTNNGGMTHTVTTCDASHSVSQCPAMDASGLDSFDASVASGASYSHTFTAVGHYYYYCKPHNWMQGQIIVS